MGAGLIDNNLRSVYRTDWNFLDKIEFENHVEMLKYVYNSSIANGRIGDALDLVRSQQRLLNFDYPFAFNEGV